MARLTSSPDNAVNGIVGNNSLREPMLPKGTSEASCCSSSSSSSASSASSVHTTLAPSPGCCELLASSSNRVGSSTSTNSSYHSHSEAFPMTRRSTDVSDAEDDALEDEEFDRSQRSASRKLVLASIICLTFMVVEVVAGLISNSLALLTDASHLLSDLCSFLISLFAIWMSTLKGNQKMSFGYHRAEIIGALASVMLIWVVTAWLVYAAVIRILHPVEVNGRIMFMTAIFGTLANLFMTHILNMHSHGIGVVHDHDHDHGNCQGTHNHNGHSHNHDHSSSHNHEHSHSHSDNHEHSSLKKHHHCDDNVNRSSAGGSTLKGWVGSSESGSSSHDHSSGSSNSHYSNAPSGNRCNGNSTLSSTPNGRAMPFYDTAAHCTNVSPGVSDSYVPVTPLNSHTAEDIVNMNLRAAYIHALGDLLQNVGVMLAASFIWWRPDWSIADPLCTFLFSIFVLMTTGSIIREALNVLMEGTPMGVEMTELQNDLLSIEGVVEVHDLHVWSLSVGKPALACHLVVQEEENARNILRSATTLCHRKYQILHTTIQTDFSVNKSCCDTVAHQKCSDAVMPISVVMPETSL